MYTYRIYIDPKTYYEWTCKDDSEFERKLNEGLPPRLGGPQAVVLRILTNNPKSSYGRIDNAKQ